MHVWTGPAEVPDDLPRTALTVGTFDGVHRGHRILIDQVVARREVGLLPVAVTFDPHPMRVLRPELAPPMLASLPRRLELFEAAGLAGTLVLPFTRELSAQTAADFARFVLRDPMHAAHVLVGRNFRFGHRAAGDVAMLGDLGADLDFSVTVVDLAGWTGGPVCSSTVIRELVAAGEVAAAARALGHPHRLSGPVVTGDARGRDLGFPTANLNCAPELALPADGVYAGWASRPGGPEREWAAAISVGTNPTFDGTTRRVEAYLLDAQPALDLYGSALHLDLVDRVRGMHRFDTVEELVAQMHDDVARTRARLLP